MGTLFVLTMREGRPERNPRPGDLAYVVKWTGVGGSFRIVEVTHAYASERTPIIGDQTKAYRVRVEGFPEPPTEQLPPGKGWMVGPVTDGILREAIETASSAVRGEGREWFPTSDELNTPRFFLSFPQVAAYHGEVERVILTAYDRQAGVLYHADVAW